MKKNLSEFQPTKKRISLTTGQVICMLRELKGWTQKELSSRCGIDASNLSLLENDHVEIGKRRALQIAAAFKVHPAILMFPEFEGEKNLLAA